MPGNILVVLNSNGYIQLKMKIWLNESREGCSLPLGFGCNLICISCKIGMLAHAMGISDRFKSSASKIQIFDITQVALAVRASGDS